MRTLKIIMAASLLSPLFLNAQENDEPKIHVRPTGLIEMDAGFATGKDTELLKGGADLPDVRVGVMADYGNWEAKLDVGYAYGKVGLKNITLKYNFDERNFVIAGNLIHQFGMNTTYAASRKSTFEEPLSNETFNIPRKLGVMYQHSGAQLFAAASVHLETTASTLTPNQSDGQGYGILSRAAYHPISSGGNVVHVGISGGFATPQYSEVESENHKIVTLSACFPTRIERVSAISATVDHAMNMFKLSPELLLAKDRVALESQYYFAQVNRRDNLQAYRAQGAYATVRGLLIGRGYKYSDVLGELAEPTKGSLECAVNYNYTTLSDSRTGIYGGRLNDVSCTFTYYFNKYILARLRYGYTHRWDNANAPRSSVSFLQMRMQIAF
jgi:phosphate-selective porin OprO/OprP